MSDAAPVLVLQDIVRTFHQGRVSLQVLRGAGLKVYEGEVIALVGPSGSGKSTLLHITGLVEKADSGEVLIGGHSCSKLDDNALTGIRRDKLGFVYQYHHLLPEFSARENIVIPQIIAGRTKAVAGARADEVLSWMGLADRADHRPARLSGGEQQRVAIARAIANTPRLLLADEPTGNLDPETAAEVFDVLLRLARGAGLAALIATHNMDLAARMDRIVRLDDGLLVPA